VLISMKTFVITLILLSTLACHEVTDRTESMSCLSSQHSPDGTRRASVTGILQRANFLLSFTDTSMPLYAPWKYPRPDGGGKRYPRQ
jgi:hypothetical protein